MTNVNELLEVANREPHRLSRLHEDKPEGPYLCACGRVCFDAEEGLHHVAEEWTKADNERRTR